LCTLPAFASHRCRSNQLASRIIWGSYGQHQIRSREDDSRDEPRRRRCEKSCPESEGHRHVCEAKTGEEKACSKEEPSSLTKNSQLRSEKEASEEKACATAGLSEFGAMRVLVAAHVDERVAARPPVLLKEFRLGRWPLRRLVRKSPERGSMKLSVLPEPVPDVTIPGFPRFEPRKSISTW
jgi:hypothetical protein